MTLAKAKMTRSKKILFEFNVGPSGPAPSPPTPPGGYDSMSFNQLPQGNNPPQPIPTSTLPVQNDMVFQHLDYIKKALEYIQVTGDNTQIQQILYSINEIESSMGMGGGGMTI